MTAPSDHPLDIPDKLFFRIGEVSRLAGIPTSVLRFWENEFPRIKPQRTESGQRVYRKKDVVMILTIKHLLYDHKFTIKGARKFLKTSGPALKKKIAQPKCSSKFANSCSRFIPCSNSITLHAVQSVHGPHVRGPRCRAPEAAWDRKTTRIATPSAKFFTIVVQN